MDFENRNQKGQLVAALQQLAQSEYRSKRARLIEIYDDVEAALAAGTTQKQVIAALEKNGLSFTLRSFETTYARIKKERKERDSERENTASPATTETPKLVEKEPGVKESLGATPTEKGEKPAEPSPISSEQKQTSIDFNFLRPRTFKRTIDQDSGDNK